MSLIMTYLVCKLTHYVGTARHRCSGVPPTVNPRIEAGFRLEAEGCGKACGVFPFPQEVESGQEA